MDPVNLVHSVSCDYMDHPVSYYYGSPCIMWLWITLYFLTNDHPVSSDNGQPSIEGCQVNQVREALQSKKQRNLGISPNSFSWE